MKMTLILLFFVVSVLNVYSQKCSDDIYDYKYSDFLHLAELITKPLLMPLLASIYAAFTVPLNTFNWYVIIALSFGWLGDIALIVHHKINESVKTADDCSEEDNINMLPLMVGLAFFLCGHITYFLLFIKSSILFTDLNAFYILIYIAYTGYGIMIYTYLNKHGLLRPKCSNKNLPHKSTSILRFAILLYMLGITLMSYSSLLRLINLKNEAAVFTFIGSLIFISSDSVLAIKILGQKKTLSEEYIMGSYIIAQLFIVIGFIIL